MSDDHINAVCIVFAGNPLGYVCTKPLEVPITSPGVQKKIGPSGVTLDVSIPVEPCLRVDAELLGGPNDRWIATAISTALEYDKTLHFDPALPR